MKINHSAVILIVLIGFVVFMIWAVAFHSPDAVIKSSPNNSDFGKKPEPVF